MNKTKKNKERGKRDECGNSCNEIYLYVNNSMACKRRVEESVEVEMKKKRELIKPHRKQCALILSTRFQCI